MSEKKILLRLVSTIISLSAYLSGGFMIIRYKDENNLIVATGVITFVIALATAVLIGYELSKYL